MSNKKLTTEEINDIRAYIKKLRKEGSTAAGAGAYDTPAAFTGDPNDDGTQTVDVEDPQYGYSIKAKKTNKNFVPIHEASYKSFKEDPTANKTILKCTGTTTTSKALAMSRKSAFPKRRQAGRLKGSADQLRCYADVISDYNAGSNYNAGSTSYQASGKYNAAKLRYPIS